MFKTSLKLFLAVTLTLGLSMSFQSLLASWTAPTVNPPGGNISEPINVGSVPQSKSGLLSLTNGLSVSGNTILDGNLTLGGGNRTILSIAGTATFGSTNSHTYLRSAATGNIYLQTGTINRLAVLAGGNVGIGTINPSQRLDVNGNINLSGANRTILANGGPATFGSTNSHLYLRSANISSNIYLQTGTTNNRLTVLGGGNVGIGTDSPSQKLDVVGKIRMRSPTVSTDLVDTVATKGYVDSVSGSGGGLGTITCRTTDWVNNFDRGVGINCGEGYLAGVRSYHTNHTEDRRFAYKCCFPQGANPDSMTTCESGSMGTACVPAGW